MKQPATTPYINTLDGLRAIAVLLVLIGHMPRLHEQFHGEKLQFIIGKSQLAYLGVDIFFVLSGFLITRILLREKFAGGIGFKGFYYRRALRIFPIFYLTVIFCAIYFGGQEIPWVATYLSNFYFCFEDISSPLRHTWSLAVEEQFYMIWPLLLAFTPRKWLFRVVVVLCPAMAIIVSIVLAVTLDSGLSEGLIYRGTLSRMLSLAVGASFALWELNGFARSRGVVSMLAIAGVLFAYGPGILKMCGLEVYLDRVAKMVGFSLLSGACVLHAIASFKNPGWTAKLLLAYPMQYIGKISYGIYLYHLPFLYVMGSSHLQPENPIHPLSAIGLLAVVIAIAGLSFKFIESPLLKLKHRY